MNTPIPLQLPRAFYAVALIGLGIIHFVYEDFFAGRAPAWPLKSGKSIFAYASGLLLIITGLSVLLEKRARMTLLISGSLILVWAALRSIIALMMAPEYGIMLTNVLKGLTMGTGAFVVADSFNAGATPASTDRFIERMAVTGRYAIGLFLLTSGLQHFAFAVFVKTLVPEWIPGNLFWTYFAAVALIAAGLGLILKIKTYLAALLAGWMVFIWFLILHLPRGFTFNNQNEWTAVCESLGVSGILFLISYKFKNKK